MANTTLGVLLLQLRADTSAFSKGLGDAKNLAFDSAGSIVQSFTRIFTSISKLKFDNLDDAGRSFGKLAGIAAGVGVGVGSAVIAVAELTALTVKQLDKLSQSYGVSIESISSYRVASKLTGVELEVLTKGMGLLAKGAAKSVTEGTGPAANALRILGISADAGGGKLRPMGDLLGDVAEKFSKMENGTAKTALALQLFGRAGAQMIPFLNEGRAGLERMKAISDELGMTWSEKDAAAAKQFAYQVDLLQLKSQAFGEQVTKGVLPALDGILTAFVTVDKAGGSLAKDLGELVGQGFLYIAQAALGAALGISKFLLDLEVAYNWAVAHPWSAIKGVAGAVAGALPGGGAAGAGISAGSIGGAKPSQDILDLFAQSDKLDAEYAKIGNRLVTLSASMKAAGGGSVPDFLKPEKVKELGNELDRLSEKTRHLLDSEEGDKLGRQIGDIQHQIEAIQSFEAAHPGTIWASQNADVNKLQSALVDLKAKLISFKTEGLLTGDLLNVGGMGAQTKGIAGALAIPSPTLGQNLTPLFEYEQELIKIGNLEQSGGVTAQQGWALSDAALAKYNQTMDQLILRTGTALDGFKVFFRESSTSMGSMGEQTFNLAQNMGNSFQQAFSGIASGTQTVTSAFRQMASSILADLEQMIWKTFIWKAISGAISGWLGGASALTVPSAGAIPAGGFVFGHDYPGPAFAGVPYAIGVPEIFTPSQNGSIVPLGGAKLGGDTYNLTVNAPNAAPGIELKIQEAMVTAVKIARKMAAHDQIEFKRRT
jgi:hypothetical protein